MRFFAILAAVLVALPSFAGKNREMIKLSSANTVVLRGEVNESSVMKAQLELSQKALERKDAKQTIYLVVDSPGGSVTDGEDLIQLAKSIPNLKTITIFAASMGSAIVNGLPGERLGLETAVSMFHRAKGGFQGQFETGEVESRLRMAKKLIQDMEKRNAGRLRMTLKDYKNLIVNELWLVGEENLKYRALDRIVDVQCDSDLLQGKEELLVRSFFGSFILTMSKCPLIRGAQVSAADAEAYNKYKQYLNSKYGALKEIL